MFRLVFKTSAPGWNPGGWVRFPHAPAIRVPHRPQLDGAGQHRIRQGPELQDRGVEQRYELVHGQPSGFFVTAIPRIYTEAVRAQCVSP